MVTVRNSNRNGQTYSAKIGEHPYIIVVDREEMVLILKHALKLEEYSTSDTSAEESSVAKETISLFHKTPVRDAANSITPLSPRQTEVLKEVAKGHPNKSIARTLGISQQTVKNHVTSIIDKLDANSRTHAVVLAMLNGWLDIQDAAQIRAKEELAPSALNK